MLQPKRTKFRKQFKGRIHGVAKGGTNLDFGGFGLKAMEPNRVTAREIEAARRAITREMKRAGRVWIRIFPDVPVTSKPTEVRMGKGKGAVDYWAARVKPGRIITLATNASNRSFHPYSSAYNVPCWYTTQPRSPARGGRSRTAGFCSPGPIRPVIVFIEPSSRR